jgi:hypothetical protein
VKTTREKADGRRAAKLEIVPQQVDSGSLAIHKMTAEERRAHPPSEVEQNRAGRR